MTQAAGPTAPATSGRPLGGFASPPAEALGSRLRASGPESKPVSLGSRRGRAPAVAPGWPGRRCPCGDALISLGRTGLPGGRGPWPAPPDTGGDGDGDHGVALETQLHRKRGSGGEGAPSPGHALPAQALVLRTRGTGPREGLGPALTPGLQDGPMCPRWGPSRGAGCQGRAGLGLGASPAYDGPAAFQPGQRGPRVSRELGVPSRPTYPGPRRRPP